MEVRRWLEYLRWVVILPVAYVSFFAAVYVSIPFDDWVYREAVRFGYQTPIDEEMPPYLPLALYGAFAGLVVVFSGTAVAPAHRRIVALALFFVGALVAISLFRYEVGGMVGSLAGGALAIACVFVATRRSAA